MVFPCRKRLLFQIKRTAGNTNEQSFTCSALLCSALLCSAVSIWRLFHPCQPLIFKRSRAFLIKKPRYIQQSPRRKTAAESCRWQLADPVGPYSFASPVCAGFADNTFGYVQYTTLPRNCKRKAAIFIANCSKFLQILHRAGNMPIAR